MTGEKVLFKDEAAGVELVAVPFRNQGPSSGPRGAHVRLVVGSSSAELLEGPARHLHLALRDFVRHQKSLRGDTPRGRERILEKSGGSHGATVR